jgi:hypothetical protein
MCLKTGKRAPYVFLQLISSSSIQTNTMEGIQDLERSVVHLHGTDRASFLLSLISVPL